LPTRILIGLSNFLSHYFYLVIFLIIGIAIGFWQFKKMYFGKKILHKLILKFPIISKIVIKIYLAQISRTLYSVLKTDIPVVQAFLLSSKVINNIYYKNVLEKVANNLKEGANIHESLEKYGGHNKSGCLFPATMIQMISVGETTGSLDNILEETAKFYEEEVNNTLEHLPALLEPILILFLGITVGGIAISIMLPIFSLTQGVENM
jgi:type IV pilus assembly protein PilC